jgi:hypothetical protein
MEYPAAPLKIYPIGFDWRADESPIDGRIQSSDGIVSRASDRVEYRDYFRTSIAEYHGLVTVNIR